MIQEKINQIDTAFRERHRDLYDSLQPGLLSDVSMPEAIRPWYSWRNGQAANSKSFFLKTYRFVPMEEAKDEMKLIRRQLVHPIRGLSILLFARRMLYSWPLLVDGAGEGYFFNGFSRRIFYRFEGERDRIFGSFEEFLELLIDLARLPDLSETDLVSKELELIESRTT